jgi:hypothetical protein
MVSVCMPHRLMPQCKELAAGCATEPASTRTIGVSEWRKSSKYEGSTAHKHSF